MRGRLYRGTNLAAASEQELRDGEIRGDSISVYEGFMDPDEVDHDRGGEFLRGVEFEVGPDRSATPVVGGVSDRLGAAQSFAQGALPIVLHLDQSSVPSFTPVGYDYDFYDAVDGSMAWVDTTATGEIRVNGDLQGLAVENDGDVTIKYWGEGLRSRARMYDEEMEQIHTGSDRVDVSGGIVAVASYVRRPVSDLSELPGYARLDTKLTGEADTVVGDWDDDRAALALYDELRERTPADHPVYVVHVDRWLVSESWGYDEGDVVAVYGADGRADPADAPEFLLGD